MDNKIKTMKIDVKGMSCASCVSHVEKAINTVPGIKDVMVNLADETANIRYDSRENILNEVLTSIKDSGYKVGLKSFTLSIKGMSCASCVNRVESALRGMEEVTDVVVNLATETAVVTYIGADIDFDEVLEVVEGAGYSAELEKKTQDDSYEESKEDGRIKLLRTRFIRSGLLSIIIFMLSMPALFPFVEIIPLQSRWYILFILTTVVIVYAGREFYIRAWKALMHRTADMNTLVSLGTGAAYLYSAFATFYPGALPESMRHIYFDTAAFIITLILFGRFLEARAKGRATDAIRKLIGLQPKTARVIKDGMEVDVRIEEVHQGDIVIVRPGERVAVDGDVIDGHTLIDESMITGESIPVEKASGDSVIGGTINSTGWIKFTARHVGKETILAQIIRMVKEAQATRAPIQRLADSIAAIFVPSVVIIAIMTFIIWMIWGPEPRLNYALVSMVTVLIIACPCALGLATPTSIIVGTGKGAENGILIKNGAALETVHRVDTIVFDKTGTLTEGKPVVTGIISVSRYKENDILGYAAAVEAKSEHPLAAAIVEKATSDSILMDKVSEFESATGHGAEGIVNNSRVRVGSLKYLRDHGSNLDGIMDEYNNIASMGSTPILVGIDKDVVGIISVADKVKDDARGVIANLHSIGLDVIMLTGDHSRTAEAVAQAIGLNRYFSDVLPGDKVDYIKQLQSEGRVVAMVGDGINDAPSLAQADVGIAMGSGTDIAMETGDITLMNSNLSSVIGAIKLSKATVRNIKQNLFGSFIYNTLGIPVAAGLLYPFTGMLLNPIFAAAAMALSSVTVVTNALRLRRFRIA